MSLDQGLHPGTTPLRPRKIGGFDDEEFDVATVACLHRIYRIKLLPSLLCFSDVTSLSKNLIFEVSKDKQI